MLTELKRFTDLYVELPETDFGAFTGCMTRRRLSKRDLFVREGEICNSIAFFERGLFRFFYLDINGNEITTDFHFSPGFITSYTSLLTKEPSRVSVQALEEMEILEINRENIYTLYNNYPLIERLGRIMAEQIFITSERHLLMVLNQSAETRYRMLLEKYPHFVQRIPLQYIASFLGITQETLSRMRRSIGD